MSLTNKQSSRIDLFNSLSKEDRNLIGPIRSIDKDGVMYDGYGFPYAPGKWNYMDGDFIKEKLWNKLSTWARSKIEKYNKQSPGYKIWHEGEAEMSIQDRISELRKKGGKRRLTLKKKSKRSKKTMKKGGKPGKSSKGDFENVDEALDFILKDYPQIEFDQGSTYDPYIKHKDKLRVFIINYIYDNFEKKFDNFTENQLLSNINDLILNKKKMKKIFEKKGLTNNNEASEKLYNKLVRAYYLYKHNDFYDKVSGYYGGSPPFENKKQVEKAIRQVIGELFVNSEGIVTNDNPNEGEERMNRIRKFKNYIEAETNSFIGNYHITTKQDITKNIRSKYNEWREREADEEGPAPITHTSSSGDSNRSYGGTGENEKNSVDWAERMNPAQPVQRILNFGEEDVSSDHFSNVPFVNIEEAFNARISVTEILSRQFSLSRAQIRTILRNIEVDEYDNDTAYDGPINDWADDMTAARLYNLYFNRLDQYTRDNLQGGKKKRLTKKIKLSNKKLTKKFKKVKIDTTDGTKKIKLR